MPAVSDIEDSEHWSDGSLNDFYKIKGGIIEGKVMTAKEIITLAKLPSRQELIAKLAGALLGNITKLAVALDAVRVQKENA